MTYTGYCHKQVLEMLVTVLNCYQREEVKWKDLSRQIIDLLLPLLANNKVKSLRFFEYINYEH